MNRSGRATPQHDFRKRYGDAMADIVELHSTEPAPHAKRLVSHDVKAALQAILADPDAADLPRVDALTRTLLMDPAWRRLRIQSLRVLTREQLAECAQYALDHFPPVGKPGVGRAEVSMALALLGAAKAWHAARRNNLVREALSLAFRVDYERATAILKKAHRTLHAGT